MGSTKKDLAGEIPTEKPVLSNCPHINPRISSCLGQEEELEKMREICEKNQELLQENDTLKQVGMGADTGASRRCGSSWILPS